MTALEARQKNICRICQLPPDGDRIGYGWLVDYGGECAHQACLAIEKNGGPLETCSLCNEFYEYGHNCRPERRAPLMPNEDTHETVVLACETPKEFEYAEMLLRLFLARRGAVAGKLAFEEALRCVEEAGGG